MSILCARLPNGVLLPAVALGTYCLEEDDPNTTTVVHTALSSGYRALDTATFYKNERTIGAACRSWDGKVMPQAEVKPFAHWVAVSEDEFMSNFSIPHGPPEDKHKVFTTSKCWFTHFTAQGVREQLAEHLKNQERTVADMFILHWPGPLAIVDPKYTEAMKDHEKNTQQRIECWRELEKLYHEKKIRVIGVSNYMIQHLKPLVEDVLERKAKGDKLAMIPMFDQFEISPLCHAPKKLKEFCIKHGIQVGAFSTLGGPPFGLNKEAVGGAISLLSDKTLGEIATKHNKPVANIALRWALQHGIAILPKSANPERVKANYKLFDFSLTDEEMATIDKMNRGVRCCPDPNEVA